MSWSACRASDSLESFSGRADLALVLGSGLAELTDYCLIEARVSYQDIPHFRKPTVVGHPGFLALASFGNCKVLLFVGRNHLYEGCSTSDLSCNIALAAALGCCCMVLTNAAGSLVGDLREGSWMIAEDVITLPLGRRSAFLACPGGLERCIKRRLICDELKDALSASAQEGGVELRRGILVWTSGPSYETEAEAAALRTLGADAVTMSILPELLAARRHGLKCAVLSLITNLAANISDMVTTHEEVLSVGKNACSGLATILENLPARLVHS